MSASTDFIDLREFDEAAFVERFGGLYEHSPWIAQQVWHGLQPTENVSIDELALRLKTTVDEAGAGKKLALLRAHPELAGRAATEGTLTAESTDEQTRARLDLCTPAEFETFQRLNTAYNTKFEFPFIMAVRNSSRAEILRAFESRLQNNRDNEFATAIENVHQIARMRLDVYVASDTASR